MIQFEPGLGVSEDVYAWSVSVHSVGGLIGGICGGVLASLVPYWYSFLMATLFYVFGFLLYGTAQYGWMIILSQLLVGIYSGLQRSLIYAYIGTSYQSYVEIRQRAGKKVNISKYCRVKDILFSLYTISTSAGYFIGAGIPVNCSIVYSDKMILMLQDLLPF
jgi:MFS family permease